MPQGFDQQGGLNAYGAVIGGQGLVELRHAATHRRVALHQKNLSAPVRKVEGALYACDAAADY
jgi:hypothetical protein